MNMQQPYMTSPPLALQVMSIVHHLPVIQTVFDLITIAFVAAIVLLSLLSMYFIFRLKIKSHTATHLKTFNTLWTTRFLLVFMIAFWALIELSRIPFFRESSVYSFLPSLTLNQQENLCKVHVVLSLGFFEPGFFVTLLFLVAVSVKQRTPHDIMGLLVVFFTCYPMLFLQVFLVTWSPLQLHLPEYFRQNFVILRNSGGEEMVLCTNPLVGTMIFAAFGFLYAIWFMFSSWKVVALVINKRLKKRLYVLVVTVYLALLVKILCLGLTVICKPGKVIHGCLNLVEFICTLVCAAVAESILVILPILDSLSIDGPCSLLLPSSHRSVEEGRRHDYVDDN